jgi:hypothetical protein
VEVAAAPLPVPVAVEASRVAPAPAVVVVPPAAVADSTAVVAAVPVYDLPSVIKAIVDRQPHLAFLRQGRAVSCAGGVLKLGFPSNFLVERAQSERGRLQELFRAELGASLLLELFQDAQAAAEESERETLDAVESRARDQERSRRRREAMEHPSLKLVREVFGEVSFLEPEIETDGRGAN